MTSYFGVDYISSILALFSAFVVCITGCFMIAFFSFHRGVAVVRGDNIQNLRF